MSVVNNQSPYAASSQATTPSTPMRSLLNSSASGVSSHSIGAIACGALGIGCAVAAIAVGIAWAVLPLTFVTGLIATISLVVGALLFGGLTYYNVVAASVCGLGVVVGGVGAAFGK